MCYVIIRLWWKYLFIPLLFRIGIDESWYFIGWGLPIWWWLGVLVFLWGPLQACNACWKTTDPTAGCLIWRILWIRKLVAQRGSQYLVILMYKSCDILRYRFSPLLNSFHMPWWWLGRQNKNRRNSWINKLLLSLWNLWFFSD